MHLSDCLWGRLFGSNWLVLDNFNAISGLSDILVAFGNRRCSFICICYFKEFLSGVIAHFSIREHIANASRATSEAGMEARVVALDWAVSLQLVQNLLLESKGRHAFAVVGVVFSFHQEVVVIVCVFVIICVWKHFFCRFLWLIHIISIVRLIFRHWLFLILDQRLTVNPYKPMRSRLFLRFPMSVDFLSWCKQIGLLLCFLFDFRSSTSRFWWWFLLNLKWPCNWQSWSDRLKGFSRFFPINFFGLFFLNCADIFRFLNVFARSMDSKIITWCTPLCLLFWRSWCWIQLLNYCRILWKLIKHLMISYSLL